MVLLTDGPVASTLTGKPPSGGRLLAGLAPVLREPLVHFLVTGALLFGAITWVRTQERPAVSIDAQELSQIVEYWQLQAQRPPSRAELKSILQERIDEELMAREARRLGMDKGDLIIRRRLAQKMEFATENAATAPSEAALLTYFDLHRARYAEPARAALRQIFFSRDHGIEAARKAASAALAIARARGTATGDPFLLPLTYADVRLDELARDYGDDFTRAASTGPPGIWEGPIETPFGFHLLQVERRMAPQITDFTKVRGQVRDDLVAERRKAAIEAFLAKLRRRYRVEVAGLPS